jgi:AcrR family transcriptional regulator
MADARAGAGRYHHGDLRSALLGAAEAVLAERGVEGFTLRECARRAGVSHAAPAHHFGDVTGLLTALATLAFETFAASMREARAGRDAPADRLRAIGEGYLAFARRHPARFRLMFRRERLDRADARYRAAASAAFAELETAVRLAAEAPPKAPLDDAAMAALIHAWALVHGLSELLLNGQLEGVVGDDERLRLTLVPAVLDRLQAP